MTPEKRLIGTSPAGILFVLANMVSEDNTTSMNTEELKGAVALLPSYEAWQSATMLHDAAHQSRPHSVSSESSLADLESQAAYLRARAAVASPAQQLMVEVAQARDTIPLAFRLGMLSVIDRPLEPHRSTLLFLINGPPLRNNEDIAFSDFAWPPNDPLERATRIGSAIIEVARGLRRRRPTPIAALHLGRPRQNLSIPTMAEYYLAHPVNRPKSGFAPTEPEVDDGQVSYRLPHIRAVKATPDLTRVRFVPRSGVDGEASVAIPPIEQLTGGRQASKLLIGRQAVSFAIRDAAKREAERIRDRARAREISPLDRRYGNL